MKARVVIWVVGAALLAGAVALGGAASVRLDSRAVVAFGTGDDVVTLPQFGDRGSHVVNYADGKEVTLTFPLTNTGRVPLTVRRVRLDQQPVSLLTPERVVAGTRALPLHLAPGESVPVTLTARAANCRYFHEREIELFRTALVDVAVYGVNLTRRVAFDHDIVVHSPMIVGCPDRTLDRSDDVRPRR